MREMGTNFKEIFIFVTGTSPQVITETIYALSNYHPPIFPDEIFIITTSLGKKAIKDSLLAKNILTNLINEFNLPQIKIEENSILVPKNKQGKEIEDICTEEDNEAIGDLITSLIKEKTQDNSVRLHCSIAGGRKTMSFYLGSALQLFGRPWDKLYHVIVSPEFECHPDFFYKPKIDRDIQIISRSGEKLTMNTSEAKIILAELPFIRLRGKIGLKGKTFRELVNECQKEIDISSIQPDLTVNLAERTICFGEYLFRLSPSLLFVFVAFLKQKAERCLHPTKIYCLDCRDCFIELLEIFSPENLANSFKEYSKIIGNSPLKAKEFLEKWPSGFPVELSRQYISKINLEFKKNIDNENLLSFLKISSIKIYASSRYGIKLEKSKISII